MPKYGKSKCTICKMRTYKTYEIENNASVFDGEDAPCCDVCIGKYGKKLDRILVSKLEDNSK